MVDDHANFAYSTLANAPGSAGTSFQVASSADAGQFPAVPFNATVWPAGAQPIRTNAEIVTVTVYDSNVTFTVTRTQESSTNQDISTTGWQFAATITKKTVTDIEDSLASNVTLLTYQNRQLGASSQASAGQNTVWLVPFRVAGGNVSASSFIIMQSFTGTVSSATTGTWAQTIRWALYSNNTSNSTSFGTFTTGSITGQLWLNSSTSASLAFNGYATNSGGTGFVSSYLWGVRIHTAPINSLLAPGLYAYGFALSTSSAGWANVVRTFGVVMDNPMNAGMNTVGAVTASSIGFQDAGVYSAASANVPAGFGYSEIRVSNNVVPYFKMGAI